MYKRLNSVLRIKDKIMGEFLENGNLAVDATLGNGHDSERILKLIGREGKLYAFDIQKEAIANSKENLSKYSDYDINYILDSHSNLDKYIEEEIDFIIYNLGYLPGGDKEITTEGKTTIESVKLGLQLLRENGMMLIVAYPGHETGKKEKNKLEEYLYEIDQKYCNVLKYEFINQVNNPPILYEIEKAKSKG